MGNNQCALIASFIAMALVVSAYFVRKKSRYLLCQFLCIIFLIVSYFFSKQFFAMIGLSVGMFRTVTFFLYENKEKTAPIGWSFLFSGLTVVAYFVVNFGIEKSAKPLDILCLVALIGYAFIFRIRNLKIVRFTMIIPTVLSILFNLLIGAAIFTTLTYLFELLANIISIFQYYVFNKEEMEKE